MLTGPGEVEADGYTLVQPDVFVVPPADDGRAPRDFAAAKRLLLAVEVLSPSSGRKDRVVKRRLYHRMDTEYWIVDADARVLERLRPGDERAELVEGQLTWRPECASAELAIDVAAMFGEALDR